VFHAATSTELRIVPDDERDPNLLEKLREDSLAS
jgi:hypothetical protein